VLIPLLEPQTIVIGGSMGVHFAKYAHFLQEILDQAITKHMTNTRIIQADMPEEIVIYGCYYYGKDFLATQKTRK
jgi:glucokinase